MDDLPARNWDYNEYLKRREENLLSLDKKKAILANTEAKYPYSDGKPRKKYDKGLRRMDRATLKEKIERAYDERVRKKRIG